MPFLLSRIGYALFEVANELFVAMASGVLGLVVLVKHGLSTNQTFKTITVTVITVGSLIYYFKVSERRKPSRKKVVFISGCDSGLGFSLTQHAHTVGFTVVAGFLNLKSHGAQEIHRIYGDKIKRVELDVTDDDSVKNAVEFVTNYLNAEQKHVLWALVNNAGVMVFGEFEWQTERLIEQQVDVNLLGTLRLTKAFCPLMRHYKGRIITVTSHCAQATLPGLAVYGATKAGLSAWSDGLRVELEKYGVKVIMFIPGSFIQQSNIMAKQVENVYEMHANFTPEQHKFYDDYFKRYNSYLSAIVGPNVPTKIKDPLLYEEFEKTLLETHPRSLYVNEPLRYKIFHFVFKYAPVKVRDYSVKLFMNMPEYFHPSSLPELI